MHSVRGWILSCSRFVTVLLPLVLIACGGGGGNGGGTGGSTSPPPVSGSSAPTGLSYPSPQTFTVGQAIAPLKPTLNGTATSYQITPGLPSGLSFNTTDGTISGTPMPGSAMPQTNYAIIASNVKGQDDTVLAITIIDVKPAISYPSAVPMATGLPMSVTPTYTAGSGIVLTWSVSPALPTGLSLSQTDGTISGTPVADFGAATYTITASNSGGQVAIPVLLSSQSGVLLDLGHSSAINSLRLDGSRVLSSDTSGHWVLWNYATGAKVASGDAGCAYVDIFTSTTSCGGAMGTDLRNQIVAVQTATGFEIRASADGHVLKAISLPKKPAWWKLSIDGSYLVVGDYTYALSVVSTTTGAVLFSKLGGPNYYQANVFAAATELRAAIFTGGQNVIETTSISTGSASTSAPYNGVFETWFQDGNRFLTAAGTTLLTYSAAGVQVDATAVTSVSQSGGLIGAGNWFVNHHNLYKVGASATPAATFNDNELVDGSFTFDPSGALLAFAASGSIAAFVDLSGGTPVRTDKAIPAYASQLSVISSTQWMGGNSSGVLFDGAAAVGSPKYLTYGRVFSIAGSAHRVAISTASGRLLHYDAATLTLEGTLPFVGQSIQLSADGNVMAVLRLASPLSYQIYALPAETLIANVPANNGDPLPSDITLSASGTVLGERFQANNVATVQTVPVGGGAPLSTFTGVVCASIVLSPDGSHIACPAVTSAPFGSTRDAQNSTQLFTNSALVSAISALGLTWLDNNHLLAINSAPLDLLDTRGDGYSIYDATGALVTKTSIPMRPEIYTGPVTVTADTFYTPQYNTLTSVSSGATIWNSGDDASFGIGAVAGSNVVFASGVYVLALPR